MSASRVRARSILALLGLLVLGAALGPLRLCAQQRDERAVRAAYVFNLIRYVDWPQDRSDLVIAVLGDAATGDVLQKMLDGKASESKTIRVLLDPSPDELALCSVAYIADAQAAEARKALERLKSKDILTVGESEAFAQEGGMVGLVKTDDHIQIQVNLEAAQHAGIRISSRVLNLAVIVRPAQNARN